MEKQKEKETLGGGLSNGMDSKAGKKWRLYVYIAYELQNVNPEDFTNISKTISCTSFVCLWNKIMQYLILINRNDK